MSNHTILIKKLPHSLTKKHLPLLILIHLLSNPPSLIGSTSIAIKDVNIENVLENESLKPISMILDELNLANSKKEILNKIAETIASQKYSLDMSELKNALSKQVFMYFETSESEKIDDIKTLVTITSIISHELDIDSFFFKTAIAEAIDGYFITSNSMLQERLGQIEDKGALEITHVNALRDLEAYLKEGIKRDTESPPEFTHPAVRANQVKLDSDAKFDPSKWADPADDNGGPHPDIGNPEVDPRARPNPLTPNFTFDPQYGRPLVDRATGVKNIDGERKILLEEEGPFKGRPINPMGKTGITGRGLLGKFGPNVAADPLVKRLNPETGLIEILVIFRSIEKQWAIPGGMVDPGERASKTACREFTEEAGSIPLENLPLFVEKLIEWSNLHNPRKIESLLRIRENVQDSTLELVKAAEAQRLFIKNKDLLEPGSVADRILININFNHFSELAIGPQENLENFIASQIKLKNIVSEEIDEAKAIFLIPADVIESLRRVKPIIDELKDIYATGFIKIILGCDRAVKVYEGYSDDIRNTDHAWMETSAWAWDIGESILEQEILLLCESGDEVSKRDMIDPMAQNLFASHSAISAKMIVEEPLSKGLGLPQEQLINFLTQRAKAGDLLIKWPYILQK